MLLEERINAFVALGERIGKMLGNEEHSNELSNFIEASLYNEWFTEQHIKYSLKAIAENLKKERITAWLERYPNIENTVKKRVGVVTAGNIPLVGFHDFLCVLMAGHEMVIKMSSKDDKLLKRIVEFLVFRNTEFEKLIRFEKDNLKNFDAIIATGSDNTSKYFEYYFGKYPNIIRKNRNSVAVLTGKESEDELNALANDIMMYFGLGCRNVSKLYLPNGYDIQKVF